MKRIFLSSLLATFVVALSPLLAAQSPQDALHAPDGNSFTRIVSIFIAPMPDAPFTATVSTVWTRQTSAGATIVTGNHRMVARDRRGRVFEERRGFVPAGGNNQSLLFRMDYVDPNRHTFTACFPANRICNVHNSFAPVSEATAPVGPLPDGKHYLSRENLGTDTIEGLETLGTRETITTNPGAAGNDRDVSLTKEFWYSPRLGVNLVVKRFDPLQGTQVFTVSNIKLAEPDARLFAVPAQFKVADQRTTETTPAK